jgi:DNA polymerase III subunit chi
MGQVVFHTGVADKVDYLARLVRKGSRQDARMVVVCDDPAAVSMALWGGASVDFVVHATAQSDAATLSASRVVLMASALVPGRDGSQDVLVNACEAWPASHAHFLRVIELVGQTPSEVTAGRERWRLYISDGVRPDKLG